MHEFTSHLSVSNSKLTTHNLHKRLINLTTQEAHQLGMDLEDDHYREWLRLLAHYSGRASLTQLLAAALSTSRDNFDTFYKVINRKVLEFPRIKYYEQYRDKNCRLLLIDCTIETKRHGLCHRKHTEEYYFVSAATARALRTALAFDRRPAHVTFTRTML